jgi:hypothetical protein
MLQKPSVASIDGVRVDYFEAGIQYEVGNTIAGVLLAEGWAEPVGSDDPAVVIPLSEFDADAAAPPNLHREIFPPYYDGPPALALDRRRRSRSKTS